jgi:malate permease and related proteins
MQLAAPVCRVSASDSMINAVCLSQGKVVRDMDDLVNILINNIAPIMAVALIGFFVGERLELDGRSLGRLIFNVFSPALIFHSLATTQLDPLELGQIALTVLLYTAVLISIAYPLIRLLSAEKVLQAGLLICTITGNNGNYGLPLIRLAFGEEVFARAVVVFIVQTLITYTFGIYIASSGRRTPREAIINVFKMPVMYVAILALLINQLHISLPQAMDSALQILKGATFPTMLILLGMQLRGVRFTRITSTSVSIALRLIAAPLIAVAAVALMNLPAEATIAVIMEAAMPVAVVTTVLAAEFDLDRDQVSSAVFISTLLSPLTLSLLIWMLRRNVGMG